VTIQGAGYFATVLMPAGDYGDVFYNALLNLTAKIMSSRPGRLGLYPGCHLYFARQVTFLSCADTRRRPHRTYSGLISRISGSKRRRTRPTARAFTSRDREIYPDA
jgi:hypothetical protein